MSKNGTAARLPRTKRRGRRNQLESSRAETAANDPTARRPESGRTSFDKVFERVYKLVLRIPRGRVMTYGQIARLLEGKYSPRLVGWAMHATPRDGRNIPWHRVINSKGGVSTGKITVLEDPNLQRYLLEAEGIVFSESGCCDLGAYQWSPRKPGRRAMLPRSKSKEKK